MDNTFYHMLLVPGNMWLLFALPVHFVATHGLYVSCPKQMPDLPEKRGAWKAKVKGLLNNFLGGGREEDSGEAGLDWGWLLGSGKGWHWGSGDYSVGHLPDPCTFSPLKGQIHK